LNRTPPKIALRQIVDNTRFPFFQPTPFQPTKGIPIMSNKLVTEAMRKATKPLPGAIVRKEGTGQRRSLERGSHTRSKKNPGKRPH
jgi:hypothetical protein